MQRTHTNRARALDLSAEGEAAAEERRAAEDAIAALTGRLRKAEERLRREEEAAERARQAAEREMEGVEVDIQRVREGLTADGAAAVLQRQATLQDMRAEMEQRRQAHARR